MGHTVSHCCPVDEPYGDESDERLYRQLQRGLRFQACGLHTYCLPTRGSGGAIRLEDSQPIVGGDHGPNMFDQEEVGFENLLRVANSQPRNLSSLLCGHPFGRRGRGRSANGNDHVLQMESGSDVDELLLGDEESDVAGAMPGPELVCPDKLSDFQQSVDQKIKHDREVRVLNELSRERQEANLPENSELLVELPHIVNNSSSPP